MVGWQGDGRLTVTAGAERETTVWATASPACVLGKKSAAAATVPPPAVAAGGGRGMDWEWPRPPCVSCQSLVSSQLPNRGLYIGKGGRKYQPMSFGEKI